MKKVDEIKFKDGARNHAGMTVPDGFFEQFQMNLEAEIDRREALKSETPVLQMSSANNNDHTPVIGQSKSLWQGMSIAAAFVLLLGLGLFMYNSLGEESALPTNEPQLAQQTETSAEDIQEVSDVKDMIISSVNDYDLYDLYCDIY